MRVAALNDIHGNLPALEAVLAEVEQSGADLIVLGGDVAAGPMPVEVLDRLRALGDRGRWLRGNGDRRPGAWVEEQVGEEGRAFLAALPPTQRVDVDRLGPTLFCHGSPRSDEEIITAVTSHERLDGILADVSERVVVCGHTHHQFDVTAPCGVRVVNAGSVGMAYEGRPGAHWALLGPEVELRRTGYDFDAASEAVLASGFPDAAEYVETVYGSPTSADEAAELFEGWALEARP